MLQNDIKDSICLDLFAGSGSIGIEAVSNGAKKVYFVDNSIEAIKIMKENINKLNIKEKTVVIFGDYRKTFKKFKNNNLKFDLIFLDPPYKEKIIDSILQYIEANDLLFENGQVICEFMNDELASNYGSLKVIKEKKYGSKIIRIYKMM